ncbi:hypothetical protein JL720_5744 [Aureococcus anophagefferens]|nr:hypothetical protein JL720_5744 [Aureococcus anophagefferens]
MRALGPRRGASSSTAWASWRWAPAASWSTRDLRRAHRRAARRRAAGGRAALGANRSVFAVSVVVSDGPAASPSATPRRGVPRTRRATGSRGTAASSPSATSRGATCACPRTCAAGRGWRPAVGFAVARRTRPSPTPPSSGPGATRSERSNEFYDLSGGAPPAEALAQALTVSLKTLFLIFATSTLVSYTLRETQARMLRFAFELKENIGDNRAYLSLVASHLLDSAVFAPIMIGMMAFLFEFFADQFPFGFKYVALLAAIAAIGHAALSGTGEVPAAAAATVTNLREIRGGAAAGDG